MAENGYNPTELLICTASRQVPDNTTAFIGTGIPIVGAEDARAQSRCRI